MQDIQVMQLPSLGQEDPLEEEMETHSSILSWEIYGQRSLAGYSPWAHKDSDTTKHIWTFTYTKVSYCKIATFCSILNGLLSLHKVHATIVHVFYALKP